MRKKQFLQPKTLRMLFQLLTVFTVVLTVVLANALIYALAYENSWYGYTEERPVHRIGSGTEAVFAEVAEGTEIRILFCMGESVLAEDAIGA